MLLKLWELVKDREGSMLSGSINKRNFWSKFFTIFCLVILIYNILNLCFPLSEEKLYGDYSTVFTDRKGNLLRITLSESGKYRIKLSLRDISPYLINGMLQYEDKYFFIHPGFNPFSLARSFFKNALSDRVKSGASTISMQIARMLYNRPRTFSSKLLELFNAIQLELSYSKNELLEFYLNLIPMGGNLEGVGAASYFYFGKPALDLSYSEAALLIGIPKNPNRNRPDINRANAALLVLKVWERTGGRVGLPARIDTNWITDASFHYRNPFRCPHLIEERLGLESCSIRVMTIDLNIQNFCESVLEKYHLEDIKKGIYNGAVIVADNRTHEVLGYIGSPDFFDFRHQGQVNGASILRSPGSAMKPFIYSRAIGKGLITPQKILLDIPKLYADHFSPVNYDRSINGLVTAEFALLSSLNIPAVRLESELGDDGLGGMLRMIFPRDRCVAIDKAGLTLAIGGFPVSLEELVSLYSALACDGNYHSLKFELRNGSHCEDSYKEIMDPRACFIVSEILSSYHRPDMPYSWEFAPHLAKIALKTGTSFGMRDAWCVGYNPHYTVGIWMGNVNSSSSPFLVGADIAAPIMIEVFDFLTKNSDEWFKRPKGVEIRKVCALSGEKASPDCPRVKDDYYIPGISSERVCTVHKKIWVRIKDNVEVCPYCMGADRSLYKEKLVEVWPPEVASFLRSTGRFIEPVPPHNPECIYYKNKEAPRILSIRDGMVFILNTSGNMENQKIPLRAQVAQDAVRIYWFAGDSLLTNVKPDDTVFYTPQAGLIKLTVVDSSGRSDSVTVRVLKKAL
jgi:penicillin-binding protein 1C